MAGIEMTGKGSLWRGALRSCIRGVFPETSLDDHIFFDFPTFSAAKSGGAGFVFVGSMAAADLGPFSAFAVRERLSELRIFLGAASGQAERHLDAIGSALLVQAGAFDVDVEVFALKGKSFEVLEPRITLDWLAQNFGRFDILHPSLRDAASLFEGLGCQVVVSPSYDTVRALYLGLEVARAVKSSDGVSIEIGVGRNDRMAKGLLGEGRNAGELLSETIDHVRTVRLGDKRFHPLFRLSMASWMRQSLVLSPGRIGMVEVVPIELARTGKWPGHGLWSLSDSLGSGANDDDLMYRGYQSSFGDDGLAFALGSAPDERRYLVCTMGEIDIGVVGKLNEVFACSSRDANHLDGSILVTEENGRIVPIERLVNAARPDISLVTMASDWKANQLGQGAGS